MSASRLSKPAGGLPAVAAMIAQLRKEEAVWSGLKALARVNQADGFDCPGCAWPEAEHRGLI